MAYVNEVKTSEGETLISLSDDTVSEETLLEGVTAHDASGKKITGTCVTVPVDSELDVNSENAVQNKTVTKELNNKASTATATQNTNGLLSAADKAKLDGIEANANYTEVDSELSEISENAVQNKVILAALLEKAAATHTHTATDQINPASISNGYTTRSFYLNTHPENNGVIVPFINNDIAFLLKRGGSAKIYYDGVEKNVDISAVFDGSASYWAINPTGITTIVIELSLHKTFTWSNTIYIDFGAANWRAKDIDVSVMNTNNNETVWSSKGSVTSYGRGEYKVTLTHNDGTGFNKIKFTFSNWASSTKFRIACLGLLNYGSYGLRETFLPKDGGSLYGGITPYMNNVYDLGSSSLKWRNIYGNLVGDADTVGGKHATDFATAKHSHSKSDITDFPAVATPIADGLMSAADKAKLSGIEISANHTVVDNELSETSENPVQNKVITAELLGKPVNKTLTNEDLNNVTEVGFYNAEGGNTVTNKPVSFDFGLIVVHNANTDYYTQLLFSGQSSFRRYQTDGRWTEWKEDKLTDTIPCVSGRVSYTSGTESARIELGFVPTAIWASNISTAKSVVNIARVDASNTYFTIPASVTGLTTGTVSYIAFR